ncbi:MAG: tetratricopeptide repeat protein [Brevinematia bacterium]
MPKGKTKQANREDKFEKFLLDLIAITEKYKIQLIVTAVVILILVIGAFVFTYVKNSNEEKAARIYDIAVLTIQNLSGITNQAERNEYYQNQVNNLNLLIQNYPATVGAVRARLFLGKTMYQTYYFTRNDEALNLAISYYTGAFDKARSKFYKSLALLGRAQCYEQKNDMTKAFEDYEMVYQKYRGEGFGAISLVGMARVKEMQDDVNTSIQLYKKVVSDFPDSSWVVFAKGKLYFYGVNPQ